MFKVNKNDLFSKNMSGSELYKTTKMGKDNSKKLVTDYDKVSFDKWMKDLIDQNGVTKYQYGEKIRKQMGRNNNGGINHNNNDSKMMKYPKIVGWSVVIGLWSVTGYALECIKNKEIVEVSNTAEDLIEWIEHDLESGKIDSSIAETYINNLDGVVINLGVTR